MSRWLSFLSAVALVAWLAHPAAAQTVVKANQGAPGNQGPWPVTISGGGGAVTVDVTFDGGYIGTVSTQPCKHYKETNTSVSTSAALVPATPLANRSWVRVCNSLLNTEGAQCICSANTTPTFAASSLGDPLAVSDCVLYNITSQDAGVPICICNGAGVRLPTAECAYQ